MMHTELIASVPELLRRQARERPDKLAYRDAHTSVTYAALATATANLAGNLQQIGIAQGDRVALMVPNSVPWVVSCLATLRAGALCVPISYDSVPPEISYRLQDSGARVLITTDERMGQLEQILKEAPSVERVILVSRGAKAAAGLRYEDLVAKAGPSVPRDPDNIDDASFIIYTSGTTGRAKGVLLSVHSMLWVTVACWVPSVQLSEADYVLSPLPLFHSYALNISVLSILALGASEYIMEKYSTQEVRALLGKGEFTVMPGVPTMFHYLLEAAKSDSEGKLPGLRVCISAGAIMTAALNNAFEERFGVKLLDGYGITETATMVTMNWLVGTRVPGSCGLPVPGLATRIIEPGSGRDVDFGEEGELIVRGPNLMKGYYNKPEETANTIRNGWYFTGDLARSDKNGYLTITGRLKELIIRGGQNIAPAEVEIAVSGFAGVMDCAVLGAPHDKLGEVPVVFVVPRPGETVDAPSLIAHCRTQLSAYKVPEAVYFVEAIPRTGSGKTMRYKLRELLPDRVALSA